MDKGKKASSTFFFVVLFTISFQIARPLRIKLTMPSPEKRDIHEYFMNIMVLTKKEAFNNRLVFK